jgi:hypothetical protein
VSELLPPDVEGALRAYLRAESTVSALFGSRVFFGVDNPSAYPVCTITRIGGGLDGGVAEGLMDVALIQVDVWGDVRRKQDAFDGMAVVLGALQRIQRYTDYAGVILHGANVQSWAFLSDEAERPRYSITVQVIAGSVG